MSASEKKKLPNSLIAPQYMEILRWIGGRLIFWIAVLLLLALLTFFGLDMARGASAGQAFPDAITATVHYLARLLHGDLGTAYAAAFGQRRTEVVTVLAEVLPRSLGLLGVSLLLSAVIGIGMGAWSARRGRAPVLFLSLLSISMPSFFLALVLQIGATSWTRYFGHALLPVGGFGWDAHLILPALVLSARPIAQLTRMTQLSMSETLQQDFIRTAYSKGLPARVVWWVHAFRVAAPPILTTLASSLRFSLSTLPVVELYFGWPGLGFTLLRSIARQDDLLSVALAMGLGVTFLILHLLAEMIVKLLDPRTSQPPVAVAQKGWRSWREYWASFWLAVGDLVGWGKNEPMPSLSQTVKEPTKASHNNAKEQRSLSVPSSVVLAKNRQRSFLRAILSNGYFLSGLVLVLFLGVLYFFGPRMVHFNPYATKGLSFKNGQFSSPPYPPSTQYWLGSDVLGRDMYSLLVAGAQQTLTLVLFATGARLALGALLGLLAGMAYQQWLDRALSGLSQVFSALPALIVAMLLILGLDVRNGIWVFVVGLTAVGWSEVFNFVRTETARLLRRPFVESAISVGNSGAGVASRHLLPNLLPALLSLASLEMAAVLLLVGELGFVGVFLGGGAFAEVYIGSAPYHYSDIPEWASLLSNVRQYARAYPWTAVYPALAFFISVMAFNLFGEGLRRLLPRVGFGITRLFNRWTLIGTVTVVFLAVWVGRSSGPMGTYRALSKTFDPRRAQATVQTLIETPRGIDMDSQGQTAQYLADQLAALGLQPAGQAGSYFLKVKRDYFEITQVPQLEAVGTDLHFVYRQDFAEAPSFLLNSGEVEGTLTVLGMGELSIQSQRFGGLPFAPALTDLKLAGQVVMLLHPVAPHLMPFLPRAGTLMVTDDPALLSRRQTLSAFGRPNLDDPMVGSPFFYISRQAAQNLLAKSGLSLETLEKEEALLPPDEVRLWQTDLPMHVSLQGEIHRKVPVQHVLAYWPGSDDQLDDRLIMLMSPYDGLRPDVQGVILPGAVNHASSVATILETLRAMKAGGYQPKRTIYVAFYASQGFDYGKTPSSFPDISQFLFAKAGFGLLKPEVVLWLSGSGGGAGNHLMLGGDGSIHLTQLTEQAAHLAGVSTQRNLAPFDISVVFDDNPRVFSSDYPLVWLSWEGSDALLGQPGDNLDALRPDVIGKTGRTLTLLLSLLGYQPAY